MANQWSDGWQDNYDYYSSGQVEAVLNRCNLDVVSETNTHFLVFCPFHGNSDTPAMAINQTTGKWLCFNPSCDQSGDLVDLPRRVLKMTGFQAARLVLRCEQEQAKSLSERIKEKLVEAPEFTPWPQDMLDRARAAFIGSPAENYMHSRGFTDDTLEHFGIGYSVKKNQVVVPMHDPTGMPIGVIGRTLPPAPKRFENSEGLPKSKTTWNFHRAKRHGDTLIVTEASFDSMSCHQAGYPCTGALLGGTISDHHVAQIGRNFSRIIIATDFETTLQYYPNCRLCKNLEWGYADVRCQGHRPGRVLGRKIVSVFPDKEVLWAAYDDTCVYPDGAKDLNSLNGEQIRQVIRNAVSNFAYINWNPEELRVA